MLKPGPERKWISRCLWETPECREDQKAEERKRLLVHVHVDSSSFANHVSTLFVLAASLPVFYQKLWVLTGILFHLLFVFIDQY